MGEDAILECLQPAGSSLLLPCPVMHLQQYHSRISDNYTDSLLCRGEVWNASHGVMDRWMDGWMDGWMGGWIDGWMDGRMDGRMEGSMDGWMDTGHICKRKERYIFMLHCSPSKNGACSFNQSPLYACSAPEPTLYQL